ncbi:hypothetical protein FDC50_03640 [Clostridium botulinum]|uniref:imm11 family protein n=1 Tax=unclassified Clostridium TaxID=2614128 RepID=UPI000500AADC|nr:MULTISPECIES: DUF1629 domain-containing protein [unclassified Clostridium]AIY79316.1 hypothetical protein U728_295 [Clostridium botulinum 202F]KAI3345692.1 hypothetical protein CIT17_11515 [Clostridium botulinum]KFX54927.1 hypothetical protein KU41_18695 [Clostridium botulinum]KFX57670.1 hypothetical protein KU40_06535 [Clostridium botulinum]KON12277.1 hypothetical protein ACP50_10110 [Clostridium botulinum]
MDYFLLKQDERYTNTPRLKDMFHKINTKDINRLNAHKIDDVIIFQVTAEERCEYLDVLDKQLFLISEKMMKIISKYDTDIVFKILPLIDSKRHTQENYYLPIFEDIEALDEKSEFNLNRTIVKKIVLNKKKIEGKKIFRIKESEKTLVVVRLDVAESLLRRKPRGISLEKLEVE